MTILNGIYSFPSIGIWEITMNCIGFARPNDNIIFNMYYSTDNTNNWNKGMVVYEGEGSGEISHSGSNTFILNVLDISTWKINFNRIYFPAEVDGLEKDNNTVRTSVVFKKLAASISNNIPILNNLNRVSINYTDRKEYALIQDPSIKEGFL